MPKNPKFSIYPKNGIYVIEVHTKNMQTKFQSNIFVFGCAMAKKKTGKGDAVTFFELQFLAFLIVVHKNI